MDKMVAHSTASNFSGSVSDPTPESAWQRESLWLTYCRLIGLPSGVLIALAALLHQLACKLAGEPTHWAATSLLIGVGLVNSAALWGAASRGRRLLPIVSGFSCVALLGGFWVFDLCNEHRALFLVLFSLTAVTWLAAVTSNPEPLLACTGDHALVEAQSSNLRACQGATAVDDQCDDSDTMNSNCGSGYANRDEVDHAPTADVPRPRWARYAIGSVLGLGFVIYMIIVPAIGLLIDTLNPSTNVSHELTDMTLSESMRLHAVSGVVMLMFLAMGASIGSFLNVVIYRLPRFRPLLWPPSACPHCHTRIAGTDNIPILAWLKLGGRCRYCHAQISSRYPIIEAVVASIFVLFYYRELLSGGVNLPVRSPNSYNGIVWILLYTKWDLVTIYFYHMLLLALLLAWGMINYDRFAVPRYASVGLITLSVALATFFPFLNPLASAWESPVASLPSAIMLSLLGCAVGGLCGAAFEGVVKLVRGTGGGAAEEMPIANVQESLPDAGELVGEPAHEMDPGADTYQLPSDPYGAPADIPTWGSNAIVSGALIGSQLGLQAVLAIFALTVVFYVAGKLLAYGVRQVRTLEFRQVPITLVIFGVTVAYLAFWKQAANYIDSSLVGLGAPFNW